MNPNLAKPEPHRLHKDADLAGDGGEGSQKSLLPKFRAFNKGFAVMTSSPGVTVG